MQTETVIRSAAASEAAKRTAQINGQNRMRNLFFPRGRPTEAHGTLGGCFIGAGRHVAYHLTQHAQRRCTAIMLQRQRAERVRRLPTCKSLTVHNQLTERLFAARQAAAGPRAPGAPARFPMERRDPALLRSMRTDAGGTTGTVNPFSLPLLSPGRLLEYLWAGHDAESCRIVVQLQPAGTDCPAAGRPGILPDRG